MKAKIFFVMILCFQAFIGLLNALPTLTDRALGLKEWESFVQTYNKTYSSEAEYEERKEQFLRNYKSLASQNKKFASVRGSYRVGVTKFTDLSSDEFLRLHTGFTKPSDKQLRNDIRAHPLNLTDSPSTPVNLDWRNYSILADIQDQGSCGSCWAFSAIAQLEAAYNWKNGINSTSLSEQYLVDCDTTNKGCRGGWPHLALEFLTKSGAATRKSYPYKNSNGECKSDLALEKYRSFQYAVGQNLTDLELRDALNSFGPLSVAIDATSLQSYKEGVLDNKNCKRINHAINLVGYVTSGAGAPYYILRNSWGSDWGEDGYFRVSAVNSCLINQYVVATIY